MQAPSPQKRQSRRPRAARAAYDGAKRKNGSKLHLAVDTFGQLLALHVCDFSLRSSPDDRVLDHLQSAWLIVVFLPSHNPRDSAGFAALRSAGLRRQRERRSGRRHRRSAAPTILLGS